MKFLFFLLAFSSFAMAHDEHDWREDFDAFLAAEYEVPLFNKGVPFPVKQRLDMEFFKKKLELFAGRERKSNEDLDIARKMLTEEYQKIGFETSLHPFGSGTNFIAEKKGTTQPEKILILSSHIDSVGNKGANDNGTGTIGVLTVAQVLALGDYPYTIRVLGFDREEKGMKGSDAYVASLQNKEMIIGDINFEMMGYHSKNDGGFHVIDCDKPFLWNVSKLNSVFLSQAVKDSIQKLNLDLQVVKTCTGRSDHASFWRHNIPAIVISENFFGGDGDPCYHSKCDIVDDRLNYPYMQNILEAVLDATEKLLK